MGICSTYASVWESVPSRCVCGARRGSSPYHSAKGIGYIFVYLMAFLFLTIFGYRKMIGPDDVIYKNRYVWNRYKNDLNQRKHHLSFETASLAFDDPFHIEVFDEENSIAEERFNITGSVTGLINYTLVTVSIVYRGDLIRIFSARDADFTEVKDYYEQFQNYINGENEN
jgi:uncharacterized DUF497 family protein